MMSLSKCVGAVAVATATMANAHNFNVTFDGTSGVGSGDTCKSAYGPCNPGDTCCGDDWGNTIVCGKEKNDGSATHNNYTCDKPDNLCQCTSGDCISTVCPWDTTTSTTTPYHGPPTTTTTVKPEHGGSGKCGPNQDQYCRGVNAAGLDMDGSNSPGGLFAAPNVPMIKQAWLSKTALTASGARVSFDDKLASQNVIRVPFTWERACQSADNCLNGNGWELNGPNARDLMDTVLDLVKESVTVILDPHNNDDGVSFNKTTPTPQQFAALWTGLASWVKHHGIQKSVIMELYNEPHKSKDHGDGPFTVDEWIPYVQAGITAIRTQDPDHVSLILVPGVDWEGAHNWTDNRGPQTNTNLLGKFQDNNWAFVMHQYFDTGFGGTSSNCDADLSGVDQATQWLEENNVQAFLTEFGLVGPFTDQCKQKWNGMLEKMERSKGWLGYAAWNIAGSAGTNWENMACNMMKHDGTLDGAASWLIDV